MVCFWLEFGELVCMIYLSYGFLSLLSLFEVYLSDATFSILYLIII